MPQDPPSRIPLPPPLDGDGADKCLEQLAAADNANWNQFLLDFEAAGDSTILQNAAWAAYVARYLANDDAYRGCMGLPPA